MCLIQRLYLKTFEKMKIAPEDHMWEVVDWPRMSFYALYVNKKQLATIQNIRGK